MYLMIRSHNSWFDGHNKNQNDICSCENTLQDWCQLCVYHNTPIFAWYTGTTHQTARALPPQHKWKEGLIAKYEWHWCVSSCYTVSVVAKSVTFIKLKDKDDITGADV